MATILRENIKGTTNFNYKVREITIPDSGPITFEIKEINCSTTETRKREYGMGFEKLVGGVWFLISETEFLTECSKSRNVKVILRKAATRETTTIAKPQMSISDLMKRIGLTTHCKQRMVERFEVHGPAQRPYLEAHLKDHFIIQGYHLYSSSFGTAQMRACDFAVCSRDYRHVWIMSIDKGMLSVVTCWNPYDMEFDTFDRWFNDHMHEIHEMPTLQDYLAA